MEMIRKPAAWSDSSMEDLMDCEAGRAYVLDQLDPKSTAIEPDHRLQSNQSNCDAACYEIYSDGSMWFINNAEDEVWVDYRDFVENSLIPGIEAQSSRDGMHWSEEDEEFSDDQNAWALDEMDRKILTIYSDDEESVARELVGL